MAHTQSDADIRAVVLKPLIEKLEALHGSMQVSNAVEYLDREQLNRIITAMRVILVEDSNNV